MKKPDTKIPSDWCGTTMMLIRQWIKQADPKGLINTYRAMVIKEDHKINQAAFKKMIKAAVELNLSKKPPKKLKR